MALAGTDPVSILMPQDRACTETGAPCTADGQVLSTGPGAERAGSGAAVPAGHGICAWGGQPETPIPTEMTRPLVVYP